MLLSPGRYELQASKTGSDTLIASATIDVSVTEVVHLELRLRLAAVFHSIKVYAEAATVQTDSSALGKVVNETAVSGLPLVTRNFAQTKTLPVSDGDAPASTARIDSFLAKHGVSPVRQPGSNERFWERGTLLA